jgi:tripeptidyl-peptidase-1
MPPVQTVTSSTKNSFNTEAKKLAAIGVTVMVSSGDDGVANFGCTCPGGSASYHNCACNADSSSSILFTSWSGTSWSGQGYFPSFPATCPYVTAVGGTMGSGGSVPSLGEEIACQSQLNGIITTGGGFSTFYPTPTWQQDAVNTYFDNLPSASTPSSGYNINGRGYPDISFVAVRYQVMIGGSIFNIYGTSASSPVMAAFGKLLFIMLNMFMYSLNTVIYI